MDRSRPKVIRRGDPEPDRLTLARTLWTLLDLFLVPIAALAVARLWGWGWGLLLHARAVAALAPAPAGATTGRAH